MPPREVDVAELEAEVRKGLRAVLEQGHGRLEVEIETNPEGKVRAFVRVMRSSLVHLRSK